jgi:DNA-directed RNA polymerase subunit M/transcription elongation factor TFIIS
MQLTCPECSKTVPAEHINIQKMVAVCPSCDAVFQFEMPRADQAKAKRRKIKQPKHLILEETDDYLRMAFRTNWRLDQDEVVINSAALSAIFALASFGLIFVARGVPTTIMGLVGLVLMVGMLLRLSFRLTSRTQIVMDEHQIRVSRTPDRSLLQMKNHVNLARVRDIVTEETAKSKKEGYDTPRYRVFAQLEDGSERFIVTELVQEYADFVSYRLNERLQEDRALYEAGDALYLDASDAIAPDVSRLQDDDSNSDDDDDDDDLPNISDLTQSSGQ